MPPRRKPAAPPRKNKSFGKRDIYITVNEGGAKDDPEPRKKRPTQKSARTNQSSRQNGGLESLLHRGASTASSLFDQHKAILAVALPLGVVAIVSSTSAIAYFGTQLSRGKRMALFLSLNLLLGIKGNKIDVMCPNGKKMVFDNISVEEWALLTRLQLLRLLGTNNSLLDSALEIYKKMTEIDIPNNRTIEETPKEGRASFGGLRNSKNLPEKLNEQKALLELAFLSWQVDLCSEIVRREDDDVQMEEAIERNEEAARNIDTTLEQAQEAVNMQDEGADDDQIMEAVEAVDEAYAAAAHGLQQAAVSNRLLLQLPAPPPPQDAIDVNELPPLVANSPIVEEIRDGMNNIPRDILSGPVGNLMNAATKAANDYLSSVPLPNLKRASEHDHDEQRKKREKLETSTQKLVRRAEKVTKEEFREKKAKAPRIEDIDDSADEKDESGDFLTRKKAKKSKYTLSPNDLFNF